MRKKQGYILFELTLALLLIGILITTSSSKYTTMINKVTNLEFEIKKSLLI